MTSEKFRTNPMFLRNQFKGDGVFEIPKIEKDEIDLENIALIGYDKLSENETDKIVHFFLDDYKFEVMWNDPEPRIEKLKRYKAVLAPNYSVYTEMPLSLKVYNTFRSRWCGAYLQSKGITVIPTVAWGEPNTFWFCFDGIAKGSIVAVSTLGVRKEKSLFMQGYNEMIRKIKPEAIICYGQPFEEMKGKIIPVDYAETNNLKSKANSDGIYIKKITGYILPFSEKGMGGAEGEKPNKLPENDSQIKHIFRKKEGHLNDTPENRSLLENLANSQENYKGTTGNDLQWYSEIREDGSQAWVSVRNNTIQNGGINNPPRPWDPVTGYNRPRKEFYIMNYENRAFIALYNIVDRFYKEDKNEFILVLADDMCPYIFADGMSADPAAYADFNDYLNFYCAQTNQKDVVSAHKASIRFLEMYRDEFDFKIDNYIEKLTFELYKEEFENLR